MNYTEQPFVKHPTPSLESFWHLVTEGEEAASGKDCIPTVTAGTTLRQHFTESLVMSRCCKRMQK